LNALELAEVLTNSSFPWPTVRPRLWTISETTDELTSPQTALEQATVILREHTAAGMAQVLTETQKHTICHQRPLKSDFFTRKWLFNSVEAPVKPDGTRYYIGEEFVTYRTCYAEQGCWIARFPDIDWHDQEPSDIEIQTTQRPRQCEYSMGHPLKHTMCFEQREGVYLVYVNGQWIDSREKRARESIL